MELRDSDELGADELGFKLRLAILEKECEDFLQIRLELVERLSLSVSAGKAGNKADIESGLGATLDNCRVGFH